MDVFLYSGNLRRGDDLKFIKFVAMEKQSDEVMLILSTPGGDPDAAYKIGRYIQSRYDNVTVFVPGFCKSAGTLLAISANELVFSPYGELGPLDIQMTRTDNIAGLESGLNISEAFLTLERRAKETFHHLVTEIISSSGGIVSFHTASHSASEIVSSLYGPIFGRIDPEEVGSRSRAMRIGEDYGDRLNQKFANLKSRALEFLSQSYTSHGFVIDREEASMLFHRVREADDLEKALVDEIGDTCRIPNSQLVIKNYTDQYSQLLSGENTDEDPHQNKPAQAKPRRKTKSNGKDTKAAS
jgi:hypothetical protein